MENTNDICNECKLTADQISSANLYCYDDKSLFTYRAILTSSDPMCDYIIGKIQEWSTKEDSVVGTYPSEQTGCPVAIGTFEDEGCDEPTGGGGGGGGGNGGAIAGAIIAVIVVVVIVLALGIIAFILYRRRRNRKLSFYDNFR